MLPIQRHFEPARSVSDKEKVALEALPPLVLEDHTMKISQPMYIKDFRRRSHFEVGEEVHQRSLHEIFPADVRRESLEEEL